MDRQKPHKRVRKLIKKFSHPNFVTPPSSQEPSRIEDDQHIGQIGASQDDSTDQQGYNKELSMEIARAGPFVSSSDDDETDLNSEIQYDFHDNDGIETRHLLNAAASMKKDQTRYDTNHLISLATKQAQVFHNQRPQSYGRLDVAGIEDELNDLDLNYDDDDNVNDDDDPGFTTHPGKLTQLQNEPEKDLQRQKAFPQQRRQNTPTQENASQSQESDHPETRQTRTSQLQRESNEEANLSEEITNVFNKRKVPAEPSTIYIDSKNRKVVSLSYIRNKLLPFREKDFKCKFSYLTPLDHFTSASSKNNDNLKAKYGNETNVVELYIASPSDFVFYQQLADLIEDLLNSFHYSKFKEFPKVFYNYCTVLLNSGFNPIQDLIVSYLIRFFRSIKHKSQDPARPYKLKRIPLKLKLVARIFSLKNLKNENFYNKMELLDDEEKVNSDVTTSGKSGIPYDDDNNQNDYDSENDELYQEDIDNKKYASSDMNKSLQYDSNWLVHFNRTSLNEFNNFNFNLLISRAIRYSIFLYWSKRKLLKKYFLNTWHKKHELAQRELFLISTWETFLAKKFFINKFYLQYLKIKKWEKTAENFDSRRLKQQALGTWKAKYGSVLQLPLVADKLTRQQFFNKIKQKHELYQKNHEQAANFNKQQCARKYFKQWQLKTKECSYLQQALREKSGRRLAFNTWKQKFDKIQTMNNDARLLSIAIFCGSRLVLWQNKFKTENSTFDLGKRKVDHSIKKRYFAQWLQLARINLRRCEFQKVQKQLMQRFILEKKFIKQHNMNKLKLQFKVEKDKEIVVNHFKSWHDLTLINVKAKAFNEKRLKSNGLHSLVRNYEVNMISKYYNYKLLTKMFKAWKHQLKYQEKLNQFQRQVMLKKFFSIWKDTHEVHMHQYVRALQISNYSTKHKMFHKWHNKSQSWIKQQERTADLFFMRNKLNQYFVRGLVNKVEIFRYKREFFIVTQEKRIKSKYFYHWVNKATKQKQTKLDEALDSFQLKRNTFLKMRVLIKWRARAQNIVALRKRCEQYVTGKFLLKMMKRYIDIDDNYTTAIEHHEKRIMKKAFDKLIASSNKQYDLRFRLETHLNEKNFRSIEVYLKQWVMKLMKLKQLEEALKLFQARWGKTKAGNLFLIWQERYYDRMIKYQRQQEGHNRGHNRGHSRGVSTSNILNGEFNEPILLPQLKSFSQLNVTRSGKNRSGVLPARSTRDISPIKSFNYQQALQKAPSPSYRSFRNTLRSNTNTSRGMTTAIADQQNKDELGLQEQAALLAEQSDFEIQKNITSLSELQESPLLKKLRRMLPEKVGSRRGTADTVPEPDSINILSSSTPFNPRARLYGSVTPSPTKRAPNKDNNSNNNNVANGDFQTPSKSRIINMSNLISVPANSTSAIKSQRLQNLKRYYNSGKKVM